MVTGYVVSLRVFTNHYAVRIRDITGTVLVEIRRERGGGEPAWPKSAFKVGTRLRLTGDVAETSSGQRILREARDVEVLGDVNSRLSELDDEMRDQASRMLLSRVCEVVSHFLRGEDFSSFESRVLSSQWVESGLEPLRVIYPGFGSAVTLATSPAMQVMSFLVTTGARGAFTISSSFTTTYRFPNGAAEERVIVGKAVDLSVDEHETLLWRLSERVLERLRVRSESEAHNAGMSRTLSSWPPPKYIQSGEAVVKDGLHLTRFVVDPPLRADETFVDTIIQVRTSGGVLLVEGARESIRKNVVISGFTVYPSRFLELLQATSARHLRNLGRFNVWTK